MTRNAGHANEKRRRAEKTVRGYIRRYRGGIVVGATCLVLTDLLLLANPWILKLAIDGLHTGIARATLVRYAAVLVGVTAVSGLFRFLMRRILIGISRKIELDMRGDFFAHLEGLSPAFFNRNRTGDLMALATNDLNAVRTLVGPGVMYTMNTFVVASFAIALMLVLSPKLTAVALLPMVLLTVAVYHSVKVIHRLFERVQQRFAEINSRAQENLSGIRVVKAYAREDHEAGMFRDLSQSYVDHNMKLFRVQSVLQPLLMAVAGLGGLFLLGFGGKLVIEEEITLGTFVAFSGYLTMLIWPTIALGWVMNIVERGLASMQRINQVLDERTEIADPGRTCAGDIPRDCSILFDRVSFRYGPEGERELALTDVSFSVADGETVAIVGPTGSGKSTVVSLILRMYDPTGGQVRIGGVPADRIPLARLRDTIGLVPQDIFLFSETIRDNIGFGVEDLPDAALVAASKTASIEKEIAGFPDGYEAMIGERGINLSGGQKQRVAIARALAKNPKILILDDALSSVDASTEESILGSMRAEFKSRTTIVISHRVSTARVADRIVVLNEGRVAESGTHVELVNLGGIYAEMFHKQMLVVDLERGR